MFPNRSFIYVLGFLCHVGCAPKALSDYSYTVQSGDTLSSIARMSGLSSDRIAGYNNITSDVLVSGQKLRLPGVRTLKFGELLQGLKIRTRREWGAAVAESIEAAEHYKRITIHHTAHDGGHGLRRYRFRNNAHFMRWIQGYHQQENHWSDIGYHYVIAKDGEILEGRLLSHVGAHVKRYNQGNIGIALVGNLDVEPPSEPQKLSANRLVRALQERFGISSENIWGHGELRKTACPGEYGKEIIDGLRR